MDCRKILLSTLTCLDEMCHCRKAPFRRSTDRLKENYGGQVDVSGQSSSQHTASLVHATNIHDKCVGYSENKNKNTEISQHGFIRFR